MYGKHLGYIIDGKCYKMYQNVTIYIAAPWILWDMKWKIKNVPKHQPEAFIVAGTAASFSSRIRWTRSWFCIEKDQREDPGALPEIPLALLKSSLKSPDSGKYHYHCYHIWADCFRLFHLSDTVICLLIGVVASGTGDKINGAASLGSVARLQKFQNMTFQVWTSKGRGNHRVGVH